MIRRMVIGVAVALAATSCAPGGSPACTPGASAACTCADGSGGAQVCMSDGSGYGACSCGGVHTDGGTRCSPGAVQGCTCASGLSGAQTCLLDGSGFDACACGSGGCSPACGRGYSCSGSTCIVDPAALWDVDQIHLHVPSTDYSGATFDAFGGLPDPLVCVTVGSASAPPDCTAETDNVLDVDYPARGTTGGTAAQLRGYLKLEVDDYDAGSTNDFIGACTVAIDDASFSGVQTANCGVDRATMNSGFTLTYQLLPH